MPLPCKQKFVLFFLRGVRYNFVESKEKINMISVYIPAHPCFPMPEYFI